jgi:ABC-type transporter Mla maintaining outer membrane lipid asymmetry ATPase subunit MlaF
MFMVLPGVRGVLSGVSLEIEHGEAGAVVHPSGPWPTCSAAWIARMAERSRSPAPD